jgi:adhesin transport system membrane fusion protein
MSKVISSLLFIRMLFSSASTTKSNLSSKFLFYVFVTIIFFVGWAMLSDFDQVISSEAKIIPFSKLQTVQHFEGGIINMIHVRAGQKVNVGSQLLSLSPIEADSGYQSKKYDYMQALARIQRLEAEYNNAPPKFSAELLDFSPSLIQNENLLIAARFAKNQASLDSFESQKRQKASELIGARQTLKLVREEHEVVKKLVERGLEPKLESVRAEKSYAEAVSKVDSIIGAIDEINDRKSGAIQEQKSEILNEIAKAKSEFSQLQQAMNVAADKADRNIIKSPISGVINRVLVSTVGGVLKAGEPAIEIVPSDAKLVFEAKVKPNDIGFVSVGQKAFIKLSTYDFSIFGSLSGLVSLVGSDSISNEKGESYYIVKIELMDSNVTSTGKSLELISGMTAQIDILTGKRSVMSYLSSPLTKTFSTAFTEK